MANVNRQEGVRDVLMKRPRWRQVLFPRAVGGRDDLVNWLIADGRTVTLVPASETRPVAAGSRCPPFDDAIFASPSAWHAFRRNHPEVVPALGARDALAVWWPWDQQQRLRFGLTTSRACCSR